MGSRSQLTIMDSVNERTGHDRVHGQFDDPEDRRADQPLLVEGELFDVGRRGRRVAPEVASRVVRENFQLE
jgi:hypothetical protein